MGRLPAAARSMGHWIRGFKDSIAGRDGSADVAIPDASVADEAPTRP